MSRNEKRFRRAPGGMAAWNALRSRLPLAAILAKGMCLALLVVGCASHKAALKDHAAQGPKLDRTSHARDLAPPSPQGAKPNEIARPKRATFEGEQKSPPVEHMANWVVDSGDNRGMPFVIVDKVDARVFVFHADGRLRGAAPALLGMARGDDTMPGIGDRKLSDIRPEERTTPAGRFVASLGFNFHGKDILWVDYDIALSLHRVVTSNPSERRLERLSTPTPLDNRISFGCINVPEVFYNNVVSPTFKGTYGVVYVLPETRSCRDIFASFYEID